MLGNIDFGTTESVILLTVFFLQKFLLQKAPSKQACTNVYSFFSV